MLAGLSSAPQYVVKNSKYLEKDWILASDVDSVILPIDACGGDSAIAFSNCKINKVIYYVSTILAMFCDLKAVPKGMFGKA